MGCVKYGSRKENKWTSNTDIGSQSSLVHVGNEGWPVLSDPIKELLFVKCVKNVNAGSNWTDSALQFVVHVGFLDTNWSQCQCWTVSTAKSNYNRHKKHHGGPGACASLTRHRDGPRIYYGKKASWQCYALGNVLIEKFGSCHSCGCYFDIYHLPKLSFWIKNTPSWERYFLMADASLSRSMHAVILQKCFKNGLRCWPRLPLLYIIAEWVDKRQYCPPVCSVTV